METEYTKSRDEGGEVILNKRSTVEVQKGEELELLQHKKADYEEQIAEFNARVDEVNARIATITGIR